MRNTIPISNRQEDPAVFDARFARSRELLSFIACCVLGGNEGLEVTLRNCWLKASRNPPRFESESAFRAWLLRILIGEARNMICKNQPAENVGLESGENNKSLAAFDYQGQPPQKANSPEISSCLSEVN